MISPLKNLAAGARQASSVMLSMAGVRCDSSSVFTPASCAMRLLRRPAWVGGLRGGRNGGQSRGGGKAGEGMTARWSERGIGHGFSPLTAGVEPPAL